MTFPKWPCVKITCKPKLLCKCLTSELSSSVLKIYFTLHGMEWSSQALGRTRDTTFLGWAWPVTRAHLWTAPQSSGETACAAPLEKLSSAFRWANSVDPTLHFDETHAQSESGKTVGSARENDCDRRMVCMAWKDKLIIWRTQEGSPGTALELTILEALISHISTACLALKVYDSENLRWNCFSQFIRECYMVEK